MLRVDVCPEMLIISNIRVKFWSKFCIKIAKYFLKSNFPPLPLKVKIGEVGRPFGLAVAGPRDHRRGRV